MTKEPREAGLDEERLRTWIGRTQTTSESVTADLVRKYCAALGLPGHADEPRGLAPRLIHFCIAQPVAAESELGSDGHPARGGFLPPVPLPRRMWAGGEVVFHGDLAVGDQIERRSTVADVRVKSGRSGQLCFVTVRHVISVGDRPIIEERQDIVYRGEAGFAPVAAQEPAPEGESRRSMTASTTLLFRYSALTFNGHRIHYDRRYAMEAEGYSGLVVHGPLQAAMLLNFAAELRGSAPTVFGFRGMSPLFDDEAFSLNATTEGDGLKLWTARNGGPVCISAEARWA